MALSTEGTSFKTEDPSLMRALDGLRKSKTRVKVTYDGEYGEMGKDHDFGYLGRTMGNPNYPNGGVKAPILLFNSRSRGGSILLDDHIVRIEASKGGNLVWKRKT